MSRDRKDGHPYPQNKTRRFHPCTGKPDALSAVPASNPSPPPCSPASAFAPPAHGRRKSPPIPATTPRCWPASRWHTQAANGDVRLAAQMLGISRATLYRRLRKRTG
ncbi:hypothetical protein CJ010_02115 [Azoarcus sp. DD4]|uniref:helix-turn-helix domain-containing protein n=1 Tax=Azoarcus sp. DD4 TaxID=2027405 RepID=UPI001161EDA3|nr:hypothetical protein CJ010_02115 [Azoarcus sp. DD4]